MIIHKITQTKDSFIEKACEKAMKELGEFYEFRWERNRPRLFFTDERKTVDSLKRRKTEPWNIGWTEPRWMSGSDAFFLSRKTLNKEKFHKFSEEDYSNFIKHELSHAFFRAVSGGIERPVWFNEGLALFVANQLNTKSMTSRPEKFSDFLSFYDKGGKGIYKESGYVVELLAKKFGKAKLLKLIKSLNEAKTENQFKKLFKKIYGFNLNYREINKLLG